MKKLLFFLFFTQSLIAQVQILPNSIGIGTGINSSIPFHINKNGEVARFQGTWPYVTFYDGTNMNGYFQAINSTFEIGTKNFYDLNIFTADIQRLNINGTTGMATFYQKLIAQNGIKLTGPLQVQGESVGGDGMILVSKGNATPAWEDQRVYFNTTFPNGTLNLNNSSTYTFNTYNEYQDLNNNFSPSTGIFTVPATGLYQFNWKFALSNPLANTTLNEAIITFIVKKNGTDVHNVRYSITNLLAGYTSSTDNLNAYTIYLNANDQISFGITQSNTQGLTLMIFTNGSERDIKISGYRIF